MSDGTTTALRAHSKVNLYLAVCSRRTDGYHTVQTVVQALELADDVRVTVDADRDDVRCEGVDIPTAENLAWRAVLAFREIRGEGAPVSIDLRKNIPAGAGLGGGSADAAAVLLALATDGRPGDAQAEPELLAAAASIGADVPFFLGPGTQLLAGRGDELVEVLPTPELAVVVLNPPAAVPTGSAYAQFDRLLRPEPPPPDVMIEAIRAADPERIARSLFNNMTEASTGLVPEIRDALRFLEARPGVLGACMAGSGSSVFGICTDDLAASEIASEARDRGWWSAATRTAAAGVSRSAAT